MQTRHLDAEFAHEGHVVLDHDDGLGAVDFLQQFGGLHGFDVGHAGDRLVDQQQLGLLRQQHADFQPLLLAVRQAAGDARPHALQPDGVEHLVDALLLRRRILPQQRGAHAAVVLERQQQIVLDRVHLEHRRLLEFAADAEHGDFGLVELGQVVGAFLEKHVAGVGPGLAGDDVHHGGLAGAVRADDGAHLARLDDEGQFVERLEAVERHADAVEIEQRRGGVFFFFGHGPTPPRLGRPMAARPRWQWRHLRRPPSWRRPIWPRRGCRASCCRCR